MTNWIETYRGSVPPWQCDVTEHFTIAYYFDRLEEADANLAEELGFGDELRRSGVTRQITLASPANCAPAPAFMSKAQRLASKTGCVWGTGSSIRPTARS